MLLKLNNYWKLLGLAFVMLLAFSCSKDNDIIEPPVVDPVEPVENSKTFIYDHFKANYLWLDELPEVDPNTYSSDQDLVNALRYEEVDRWSYVANLQEHNALFDDAQTKGFGVGMSYFVENEGEENEKTRLLVRFTYLKAPMGLAGVDRGWEFYKINDVSVSSMENPWEAFDTDSEVKFTFITTENDTVDHSMTRTDYEINTVLHKSVLEVSNRKVGYLVYESFLGEKSITELDSAFSYFTTEGIEDIVVDLRYNGGGSLWLAYHLSAQLGGSDIIDKHFISFKYNSNFEDEHWAIPSANHAVNLPRLHFITTEGSASASEMVINCLFPYKEVILIGEKTHGKPVGMEVEKSEDYNIALAAVTFQLLNAHGNGHYFSGIPVDHEVDDDIFKAWGDPQELCLKKALSLISGEDDQVALKSARVRPMQVPLERGLQEITGAY